MRSRPNAIKVGSVCLPGMNCRDRDAMEGKRKITSRHGPIPPLSKGGWGDFVKPYNSALKPFFRRLRSNMTDAEQVLWQRLRRKQLLGLQFYRQKPLRDYIVDFYCPKAALVIEIDGSQHLESQHEEKDARRDRALAALGLRVLRFDSRQVLRETDAVVEVIYRNASDNPP